MWRGSALAAAALSLSGAALSASDEFDRGKPQTGVQTFQPVQPSQYLSGSGDVRGRLDAENRGSAGKAGDAVTAKPEAGFSTKSTGPERPSGNPEQRARPFAERDRVERVRPVPPSSRRSAEPAPPIQDRSGEVR
jgi:hypothetical protein